MTKAAGLHSIFQVLAIFFPSSKNNSIVGIVSNESFCLYLLQIVALKIFLILG
jgi:hypothetical protein